MKFKQVGNVRGDETAPYEVTDYKAQTVADFVDEVLREKPREWGYISVFEGCFFNAPRCEYRDGKLLSTLQDNELQKIIVSVKAEGGWSRMDYYIKVMGEGEEKELPKQKGISMKAFEIKTDRSDYPFLVIADSYKKAVDMLYDKGIYDSNIIRIEQLETYKSNHILIEEILTAKAELEQEVRSELLKTMPQWKRMLNGAAGGGDRDIYLVRSSKGHYFTSACLVGDIYYLELESLEQLPGLKEDRA